MKNSHSLAALDLPVLARKNAATVENLGIEKKGLVSFPREHGLWLVLISVFLPLPCFWHSWLVAGDFGSHLYNAWLAQLVEQGQAPGLRIAPQWNNVLFDLLLSELGKFFSLPIAGKIAASLASLLFFWGAFAFARAAIRRPPWAIVPLLAAISYGWTFQEGLFNYYLSIGMAFLALAFFWRGKNWLRTILILVSPVIAIAQPLGFLWFIAGAVYLGVAKSIPQRYQAFLVLLSVGAVFVAHKFLFHHYRVEPPAHSVTFFNGLDQLVFTFRYFIPVGALILFTLAAAGLDLWAQRHDPNALSDYLIPLQLYLIVEAGVFLLPDAIYLPQFASPISLLTERLTLVSAVLFCSFLAVMQPRRWHLPALLAISACYFAFLYQDTAALSRMQQEAWRLVHAAPPGERILATIAAPLKYRFSAKHIVDQACIGYCFSYGNYEARTTQFRIRAAPGNRFVIYEFERAAAMERGEYIVQPLDLPASQIYQCGPTWQDLCIHELQAGERNDSLGLHPELGVYPRPLEK